MAAMSPAAIESLAGEILASASLGPHAVFSLRADAGRDAFKARYRELARALHPDKARSRAAEEAFKVVTESFRAVAAANGAGGGGCAGARTDDARDSTSKAPFWRVRGEDAAAAPPRWSAGAGAREKEQTPAAPRWSAAARGPADAAPPARAFEKSSRGGWRPGAARAHGGRREASPIPETVRLDETLVEPLEDDKACSFDPDPSPTEPPAWFDRDAKETKTKTKTRENENATARWNDSATHSGRVFFRSGSAKGSSRARTGAFTVAEEDPDRDPDPFPYDEILETDPERDDVEDASFGGEKVWAHTSRETQRGGTGGGWGDASKKQKREKASLKNGRDAWRGGWSDATDRRAPLAAAARAAAGDFRGFDVADVGDPSELERLACEGNETNERFGVENLGNDENDDATARARTKQNENARDEDAPLGAAGPSRAGGGAEAGKTNPTKTKAGSRKRGRSKKAAKTEVPAAPRPRLAALDEPRIPHTKLPRKKFAQATLAFS